MATFTKTTSKNGTTTHRAQVYLGKVDGKPKFRSKTFPTLLLAKRWAARAEADRDAGTAATKAQADAADGRLSVGDYWRDTVLPWRRANMERATVKGNVSHWTNHLAPTFDAMALAAVRRADVNAWVVTMREAGVGVPTIEKALHLLSGIYTHAIDNELVDTNPATGIKVPRHLPRDVGYLSPETVAAILEHTPEPYRLFLEVSASLGLRFGEAAGLVPESILSQGAQVRIRKVWTREQRLKDAPKTTGSYRVQPVPTYLRARLAALALATPAGFPIFTGAHGGGLSDSNLRNRVLVKACAAAGVERVTPHMLRHAYASWMVQAGVNQSDIAAALGHSSTRMLDRYAHLAPGHGERLLEALEATRGAASTPPARAASA